MRIPFIMILVAAMLAACGSLGTTRATDSSGTTVQATSVSQTDDAASDKKLKGGVIRRALVVSGNKSVTDDVSVKLTSIGFTVSSAESGESALKLLDGTAADALPKVIFIKTNLPGMDVYKTTGAIKSNAKYNGIPIILMMIEGDPLDKQLAQKQGAVGSIVLPLNTSILDALVRRLGI